MIKYVSEKHHKIIPIYPKHLTIKHFYHCFYNGTSNKKRKQRKEAQSNKKKVWRIVIVVLIKLTIVDLNFILILIPKSGRKNFLANCVDFIFVINFPKRGSGILYLSF
jgi:hypothetical protein